MFRKRIFFVSLLINASTIGFAFDGTRPCGHHDYIERVIFFPGDTVIPVKIKLEKSSFNDMFILFVTDTAQQTPDIGPKFSKGYSELMKCTQEGQLHPKKFLAWYYSKQPPWIMDVAVETDRLPSELKGRIKSRIEKGGELLIAHVWGPYSELGQAYIQIENWLKQNKRTARGNPFEVYLNDPVSVKNPSEIQTDIYQPLQ